MAYNIVKLGHSGDAGLHGPVAHDARFARPPDLEAHESEDDLHAVFNPVRKLGRKGIR
jgi:hypothetical protein